MFLPSGHLWRMDVAPGSIRCCRSVLGAGGTPCRSWLAPPGVGRGNSVVQVPLEAEG